MEVGRSGASALAVALVTIAGGCGPGPRAFDRFVTARPMPAHVDAALVFGCNSTPAGEMSPCLRRRMEHAVELWRTGRTRLLVLSGGRTLPVWASEARLMGDFARAAGVPGRAIVEEGRAQTTLDNLVLSAPLLRSAGAHTVALVSHGRHFGRIVRLAITHGLDREFELSFERVP